jgi:hypothetical protein
VSFTIWEDWPRQRAPKALDEEEESEESEEEEEQQENEPKEAAAADEDDKENNSKCKKLQILHGKNCALSSFHSFICVKHYMRPGTSQKVRYLLLHSTQLVKFYEICKYFRFCRPPPLNF